MDTLDALLSTGSFPSFALLSQSERFQRQWPSLYDAVEEGRINEDALRVLLVRQLPQQGICVFPLDGSSWPRPRAQVLEDRQYVYRASSAVNGGTVTIGYSYSWLAWCAEPHSSWALPSDGPGRGGGTGPGTVSPAGGHPPRAGHRGRRWKIGPLPISLASTRSVHRGGHPSAERSGAVSPGPASLGAPTRASPQARCSLSLPGPDHLGAAR